MFTCDAPALAVGGKNTFPVLLPASHIGTGSEDDPSSVNQIFAELFKTCAFQLIEQVDHNSFKTIITTESLLALLNQSCLLHQSTYKALGGIQSSCLGGHSIR
jgi:hypothetical protein